MHKPNKCHLCGWIWCLVFFSQIVCWPLLSSFSINQGVMSCVTVRGIILQFGSGCGLKNGPSVAKPIWRKQKVGLYRSFASNIHQQFHLSLKSLLFFLVLCLLCDFRRQIVLISREKEKPPKFGQKAFTNHWELWSVLVRPLGCV